MTITEKEIFVGKYCKLQMSNGFLVRGTVISVSDLGIIFSSSQCKSFVAWTEIAQLTPVVI